MARFRSIPGVERSGVYGDCRGRTIWVATRHGKAKPLARGLGKLGLSLCEPDDLDTDRFGTFSGEVERTLDAEGAARAKIVLLRERIGPKPAIATEGSFGPHPSIPFLAVHRELLVFSDPERSLDLVLNRFGRVNNFAHADFGPGDDPAEFLRGVGFPGAAIILRPLGLDGGPGLAKGITDPGVFAKAWAEALALSPLGKLRVEADMRAHFNPCRQRVLARLGGDLARRLITPCPDCAAPGFGLTARLAGLPCRDCATPTHRPRLNRFSCAACGGFRDLPVPGAAAGADPGHCPACNP